MNKPSLTPRQEQVARLFLSGRTNQQIARSLRMSAGTVGKHISDIRARLDMPSSTSVSLALTLQAILKPTAP